jgi:tRNA-dihydrouridine synthase
MCLVWSGHNLWRKYVKNQINAQYMLRWRLYFSVGLATSFLHGSKEEWSLVRRHPSESIFGVQVAGNKPSSLVPTAEVLSKECSGNIDFVDVNCGCPIDLVFKTGSGSACA